MTDKISTQTKKAVSTDWLVRGILTKLGEMFDRFTGRNWQPSSSLATSELIEKLKKLLDAEARNDGAKGTFVPHNIKLLMQWDKFSIDSETALKKLENELLIAAIDHINDKRYQTFAPVKLEIKNDYFTEGVRLLASFDNFVEENERELAVNVTVPDLKNVILNPVAEEAAAPEKEVFSAEFTIGNTPKKIRLAFEEKERKRVGRTKENDLAIDDESVSKVHAALVLNSDNEIMVADTGSTNGTFVNGERIAYGRAFVVKNGDKLRFGTIEVLLERLAEGNFATNKSIDLPENPAAENELKFTKQIVVPNSSDKN